MHGATLLAALLLAFSASQASPLQRSSGDYASQLTRDKDAAEEAQRLKVVQRTRNLKDRLQDDGRPTANLLEKLSLLTGGLQPWPYREDARGLRELIRREMEGLRAKLSPSLDEGGLTVGQALDGLRCRLALVAEELRSRLSLHAEELSRQLGLGLGAAGPSLDGEDGAQVFGEKAALLVDRAKAALRPHAERLVKEIQRGVEELHRNVAPPPPQAPLTRSVQELAEKLTRKAQELQAEVESGLERLKGRLGLPPLGQRRSLGPDWEEMGRDVRERVEAFGREASLQVERFTRAMEKEMAGTRLQAAPAPPPLHWGDVPENAPPWEDLPSRLDSLWKDISRGLTELGGGSGGGGGGGSGGGGSSGSSAS